MKIFKKLHNTLLLILIVLSLLTFSGHSVLAETSLTWATKTSMSTGRQLHTATASNGKLYVIGGYDGTNVLSSVEEYDPNTDIWTAKATMSSPRYGHSASAANGRIYVFGGYNNGEKSTVYEYNPMTDSWTTKTSMPSARHSAAAATASNGKIYVIGGFYPTIRDTVEEYDPLTDTWTAKTNMPTARYALGLVAADNGKLYAIGGFSATDPNYENKVEEYDPNTDTWATKSSMPTRRTGLAVAMANNGRIYAFGGYNGGYNTLNTVEEYNPNTNTWATRTNMPTSRYLARAATGSNGKLYVIGGYRLETNSNVATVEEATIIPNNPPSVGTITTVVDPVQVNTSINASASFTDSDTTDTHTAVWDWGDGITAGSVTESNGSGSVSNSHTYSAAGVYTIKLTVTDNDNGAGESIFQYVVVYDPSAGYVTGAGTITSPLGAYSLNTSLTGKAIFGFVSKYKNKANTPTGQTQFRFTTAQFTFQSTSYDWLVVGGPKAQYKGSGTINGSGDYGFILTAIDGQINGGGGSDKFRIKIYDKTTNAVIYDNQMGASDTSDPTTILDSGSVMIHP